MAVTVLWLKAVEDAEHGLTAGVLNLVVIGRRLFIN